MKTKNPPPKRIRNLAGRSKSDLPALLGKKPSLVKPLTLSIKNPSLTQIRELASGRSKSDLRAMLGKKPSLAKYLSLSAPARSKIAAPDLLRLAKGTKTCEAWGLDPNGQWICIKWV